MTEHDNTTTIVATFDSADGARAGVRAMLDAGFDPAAVGVLLADSADARQLLEDGPGKPAEAAAFGSAVGGSLFGLAAVALAGPVGVLAVGPLAAALGGATVGAGAGGLLGALVGLGIPENEAALRVAAVERGGVLVTYKAPRREDLRRVRGLLHERGAQHVFGV